MKDLQELTTHCIRCGFCLEACPTFLVTGQETESPRGRIYLVRSALEEKLSWDDAKPHLDRCLGCLSCVTACPSGVEYGSIIEMARDRLEAQRPNRVKGLLLSGTTNPSVLRAQLQLGKLLPGRKLPTLLSKLLSGEKPEADRPQPQTDSLPRMDEMFLPPVKGEVYLLEGCAMRVLYPRVHQATRRLLRRIGYVVRETTQGCCGALHAHNGHLQDARKMGRDLLKAFPEDLPVIVNSAGCGSTMKEYGHLLEEGAADPRPLDGPPATDHHESDHAGARFARRVFDASEFLATHGLFDQIEHASGLDLIATYHDACHLAHGQGVRDEPRALLRAIPRLDLRELPEADICCGSAGIYNVMQPKMARSLVDRKMDNILATGASVVATGNPGCHAWIAQAARERGGRIAVLHTMELLEAGFIGIEPFVPAEA